MKFRHFKYVMLLLAGAIFYASCTPYKDIPYFTDIRRDTIVKENITNFTPLTIQPGDLLGIHVTSLNNEASAMFNYNLERTSGGNLDRADQNAVVGFLVDHEGAIQLPMIGAVKVQGLSTFDAAKLLNTKLSAVLTQPNVNVRIQNFKISVLGDVKNPGNFSVNNERISVTEAISMAGDLNITGIRTVLLIREVDGTREYIPMNLQSKDIFTSPYYYLKKNDVLYVQPNKARAANDGATFQRASVIVSVLSVIAILLTR